MLITNRTYKVYIYKAYEFSSSGQETVRGLINYSAVENQLIMGKPSHQIKSILGYIDNNSLIHRNNLVVL